MFLLLTSNLIQGDQTSSSEKDGQEKWSLSHCFFALMGGLQIDLTGYEMLFDDSQYIRPIHWGLCLLALSGKLPDIPKAVINDKSKADSITKALVCTQAGWFILQLIGRLADHLPITLLEINTLGHVICAFVLYGLWWEKPLNIVEPIVLPGVDEMLSFAAFLRSSKFRWTENGHFVVHYVPPRNLVEKYLQVMEALQSTEEHWKEEAAILRQGVCQPGICSIHCKSGHTEQELRLYQLAESFTERLFQLELRMLSTYQREKGVVASRLFPRQNLGFGLPSPYFGLTLDAYEYGPKSDWPGLGHLGETILFEPTVIRCILSILTVAYGGLHCAAGKSNFPTDIERYLWLSCSAFIAGSGPLVTITYLSANVRHFLFTIRHRYFVRYFPICCITIYGVARLYIIVEALASLRNVPVTIYVTPSWTQSLPHL